MVGMDTFATEARVGNMASEIVLDSVTKDLPHVASAVVPPLLVINVQLPSAPPALMSSAEDGPGYQVNLRRVHYSRGRAVFLGTFFCRREYENVKDPIWIPGGVPREGLWPFAHEFPMIFEAHDREKNR